MKRMFTLFTMVVLLAVHSQNQIRNIIFFLPFYKSVSNV